MTLTSVQINKLVAALPGGVDARRQSLLPCILEEWSKTDLQEHLTRSTPKQIRAKRRQIEKVTKQARELKKALSELDNHGRFAIVSQLLETDAASRIDPLGDENRSEAERRLGEESEWLEILARAAIEASTAFVPLPLRHNTVVRYLILQDLAAFYEWATEQRAERLVSFDDGTNCGPFWDFTCAAWLTLFESAAGLDYALKSWATAREQHEEFSPIIWNIDLRHPEWRIREIGHSDSAISTD